MESMKRMNQVLHVNLLSWFELYKRDLSFRKNKDPYRIWVSEIMLQQTRVNHMLPIYEKFMERFPNISTLANSNEDQVFSYWKGLGYYSRAINLWKGAKLILEKYNGIFPNTLENALKIPGVGAYTSRAVLSIAFNQPQAVLDGNVKRVLARFYNFSESIDSPKSNKHLQILADGFLNRKNPAAHNQAMMELGSLVCKINPECKLCPLNMGCKAYSLGLEKKLPVTTKDKKKVPIHLNFVLLKKGNDLLICKYKERRFFKKIFTLPFFITSDSLKAEYMDNTNLGIFLNKFNKTASIQNFGKHSITHHDIQLYFTELQFDRKILPSLEDSRIEYKWIDKNNLESEFPSSIAKKLLKVIQ